MKTTSTDETSLIFIFRFSILYAANKFWEDFNEGNLKSSIKTKLQSFSDENNCFTDETIQFDIVIDPDDFEKVHHTLQNPQKCKSTTRNDLDHAWLLLCVFFSATLLYTKSVIRQIPCG